jgi:hypothetical protein
VGALLAPPGVGFGSWLPPVQSGDCAGNDGVTEHWTTPTQQAPAAEREPEVAFLRSHERPGTSVYIDRELNGSTSQVALIPSSSFV